MWSFLKEYFCTEIFTATATDTAMRTITCIKKESEISLILLSPGKQRGPQRNRNSLLNVDDFSLCMIHQMINEFYATKRMLSVSHCYLS